MGVPVERKRVRNPRGQGDALREEIVEATWHLLNDQVRVAALALSLREVAREVGITAQSIYRHFQDKEDLARAVLVEGYSVAARTMLAASDALPADAGAAQRLRAQAHGFCAFAAANRGVLRLMFGYSVGRVDPDDVESDHPASILWRQWLDAISACERDGIVWSTTREQVALRLWAGLLGGFVLTAATFAGTAEPGALDEFTDQLVDALLADGAT